MMSKDGTNKTSKLDCAKYNINILLRRYVLKNKLLVMSLVSLLASAKIVKCMDSIEFGRGKKTDIVGNQVFGEKDITDFPINSWNEAQQALNTTPIEKINFVLLADTWMEEDLRTFIKTPVQNLHLINATLEQLKIIFPENIVEGENGLSSLLSLSFRVKSKTYLKDAGVELIAKSPVLKNLVKLDLTGNQLGSKGANAIAESEFLSNLKDLNLSYNCISSAGTEYLAKSLFLKQLEKLNLQDNCIAREGGVALALTTNLTHLNYLNIKKNRLWVSFGENSSPNDSNHLLILNTIKLNLTKLTVFEYGEDFEGEGNENCRIF